MGTSRKTNITLHGINKNATILHSDDDFEKWYTDLFDFSMFYEDDAIKAMNEDRPEYYPCIPLYSEENFEIMYLEEALVERWFKILHQ